MQSRTRADCCCLSTSCIDASPSLIPELYRFPILDPWPRLLFRYANSGRSTLINKSGRIAADSPAARIAREIRSRREGKRVRDVVQSSSGRAY